MLYWSEILLISTAIYTVNLRLITGIELTALTKHICLGHKVIYECMVNGTGGTSWGGTALEECPRGNIFLRHSDYRPGYELNQTCGNNGVIRGHAVSADNETFTSWLILNVSDYTVGDTIECSGGSEEGLERAQITLSNDIAYPLSPTSVNFSTIDSEYITFSWDPEVLPCHVSHYLIITSGCGVCPNTSNSTRLSCYIGLVEVQNVCTISVTTVLDENVIGNQSTTTNFIIQGCSYPGVILFIVDETEVKTRSLILEFNTTDFILDIDDSEQNSTSSTVTLNVTIYTGESRQICYSTTVDIDLSCNTSCTHSSEVPSYPCIDVTKNLFGVTFSYGNTTLLHHECTITTNAITSKGGQQKQNNTVIIVVGLAFLFVVICLVIGIVLASAVAFVKIRKNKRTQQHVNFIVQENTDSPRVMVSPLVTDTEKQFESTSSLLTVKTQQVKRDNNQTVMNNTNNSESKDVIYAEIGPSSTSATETIITYMDDDTVANTEIQPPQEDSGQ